MSFLLFIFVAAFVALFYYDKFQTQYAITKGLARELNPLQKFFLKISMPGILSGKGPNWYIVINTLVVSVFLTLGSAIYKHSELNAIVYFGILSVMFGGVVYLNYKQIKKIDVF